jgi:nitroreductase
MSDLETAKDRIAFLRGLRAVRHYRPDPLPQEVIDDILDVARWSGSASNRQPWELVLVRDRDTLDALASVEGHAAFLEAAGAALVLVMSGDPERVAHETYDEGRLAERIMLAAHAHGVGSSIGWFVGSGVSRAKTLLGIPESRLVRTVIALGYMDQEAHRAHPKRPQARKPLSELLHEERYATAGGS